MSIIYRLAEQIRMMARPAMAASALLVLTAACVDIEDSVDSGYKGDETVVISAKVKEALSTRSYQAVGPIEEGRYYMTYPTAGRTDNFDVCQVNFYEGTGVTTTRAGYELKWQEVGSIAADLTKTQFFLDNVPPPEDNPETTLVPLNDDYNPFVAGIFDDVNGTNDLLWGNIEVPVETKESIDIALQHNMARVNVVVTIDNTNENAEVIDFENGTVTLTNIICEGESYDRLTGRINLGESPEYRSLSMKDDGIEWKTVSVDQENPGYIYYQTQNFVLPPQSLLTDSRRSRLVIEVPQSDGTMRSYTGVVPRVMNVYNAEDGSSVPMTLAFDAGKNLTLRVKISQNLLFMESIYADVQDWVNKGSFVLVSYVAGMYEGNELNDLIHYYVDAPTVYYLSRYGVRVDGVWIFDILKDIEVEAEKVAGKMNNPDIPYRFNFNNFSLTIITKEGEKISYSSEESAEALYLLMHDGEIMTPNQPAEPAD